MEESPIITSLAGIRGLQASRRELLAGGIETSAFRLVDGEGDGLKGVYVDELAGHWIVHTKERGLPREWEGAVEAGLCQSVWWKMLDNVDKRAPVCVVGHSEETFPAEEGGLRYEIQPAAGYNCGLFIDQRLNRSRVRKWTLPGQTVLNLFSYTCSFSVAAASSGAPAVTAGTAA